MSIPLPGSGVVYLALKDFWSWVSTRLRGRRLTPDVFRGWTVDEWYPPYPFIERFGNQDWLHRIGIAVKRRDEVFAAQAKLNLGWPEERERYDELDRQYRVANHTSERFTALICDNLREQLTRGELIARGFREPLSHGAPYLTISRHEWRIIELKLPDRAEGGGIGYAGLTIGKPGTKGFFGGAGETLPRPTSDPRQHCGGPS